MGKLYLFTDNPVSCPLPFLLSVSAFCILVFCYYLCFELFVDRLSWLTVRSAREWEYTLEPIVLDTRLAPSAFATADAVADYVLHILTPTVTWVGADVREGQMPGQQPYCTDRRVDTNLQVGSQIYTISYDSLTIILR